MSDIPRRFLPGGEMEDAKRAISDMVNAHLGEMREIDGQWVPLQDALVKAGLVVDSTPSPEEERDPSTHLPGWVGGWVGG